MNSVIFAVEGCCHAMDYKKMDAMDSLFYQLSRDVKNR